MNAYIMEERGKEESLSTLVRSREQAAHHNAKMYAHMKRICTCIYIYMLKVSDTMESSHCVTYQASRHCTFNSHRRSEQRGGRRAFVQLYCDGQNSEACMTEIEDERKPLI